MEIILDFKEIHDKMELHKYLKKKFGFPDYYGMNLDALYDCLTQNQEKKYVNVYHFAQLREQLGDYADVLLQVMQDADVIKNVYEGDK